MKCENTDIRGLYIIEPDVFGDNRGWFMETYSHKKYKDLGIDTVFIQDNKSFTAAEGTIRGMHFQTGRYCQSKLVSCARGRILDVAADLRKDSPTYMKWTAVELSADNKKQFFIPKGFAHGFLSLTDNVEVEYKVDEYYAPGHEGSIRYDDPDLAIEWGSITPILSDKDKKAPYLSQIQLDF
jgi:dTDP-4-dehydrorhamnose 3,5-epimerase